MVVTEDTQVEFNGLLLEGPYEVQAIDGLADYPEVRSSDATLLGRHGLHPGVDLLGGKTVNITVAVYGDTLEAFATACEALRDAFVPAIAAQTADPLPLTFQLSGIADSQPARLYVRPRRLVLPMTSAWWAGTAVAQVQLVATDPLIYTDTLFSATTTLPATPTGLGWNLSWSLTWGTSSAAGSIFVTNAGNFPSHATIRVDGPVTNPRVENVTVGKTIELDMVIPGGDWVVIDTGARTVLLNGTASRYSELTNDSRWWDVVPGVNEITFRAQTPTAATMTIETRSAYA